LRLRLEQVGDEEDPAARGRDLEAALGETDRLEATIADLLALAREASAGATATVNAGGVAHDHAERWRPTFARARRELQVAADKNVLVRASRGTVGQVLDVLLDNALRHGSGPVRISVVADARVVRMTVADGGPGVAAKDRDRIFERGASQSGGAGIGLHLARALAQVDNGGLRVLDGPPTRLELRLPRVVE
jgi:signal transduction histidine kinase